LLQRGQTWRGLHRRSPFLWALGPCESSCWTTSVTLHLRRLKASMLGSQAGLGGPDLTDALLHDSEVARTTFAALMCNTAQKGGHIRQMNLLHAPLIPQNQLAWCHTGTGFSQTFVLSHHMRTLIPVRMDKRLHCSSSQLAHPHLLQPPPAILKPALPLSACSKQACSCWQSSLLR
jgi:hypothetical protein